jgi:hypothetical protein
VSAPDLFVISQPDQGVVVLRVMHNGRRVVDMDPDNAEVLGQQLIASAHSVREGW